MPDVDGMKEIFRKEALEHRFRAAVREGNPLRLSSAPLRWIFWLVLATVCAGLLFASYVRVGEFAIGPGVVGVEEVAAPGEVPLGVATGAGSVARCTVTAYLPARSLPDLRPGQSARVLLTGFEAEHSVMLDEVDPRIVSAHEVRRALSDPSAFASNEPAVSVVLQLDSCALRSGTRDLPYADGMRVTLEVKIRSQSILSALFPGLRSGRESDR